MKSTLMFLAVFFFSFIFSVSVEAGVDASITGQCSVDNDVYNINTELLQPESILFECLKVGGIPQTYGLVSLELLTADTPCGNRLSSETTAVALTTSAEFANWGINQAAGMSSPFPIGPCPPVSLTNYGRLSGNQSAYSVSIGSLFQDGPVVIKTLSSKMTWNDSLEIVSDQAQVISLPVHISGSIFASESFGTSKTRGYAKLSMSGSITGTNVNEMFDKTIEVESVSIIPEQADINVSMLIQIPLLAGPNVLTIDITGIAEVTSAAQGAGFITGAATAGVNYSDTISIGRFVNSDGSTLPQGILIQSNESGIVFEDTTIQECNTDMDNDNDVDGLDLANFANEFIISEDIADLQVFAIEFGTTKCFE